MIRRRGGDSVKQRQISAEKAKTQHSSFSTVLLTCPECEAAVTAAEIIELNSGTGFAASGGKLSSTKIQPAFQC